MVTFLDWLADEEKHLQFQQCGDVVVSPRDNMVALFCLYCRDIFTSLPKFMRHLQAVHGDVLHFTQGHNVYSVEELMSDDEAEAQTSNECVRPGEAEESDSNDSLEGGLAKDFVEKVSALLVAAEDSKKPQAKAISPPKTKKDMCNFPKVRIKTEDEKPLLRLCDTKSHSIARKTIKSLSTSKEILILNSDSLGNLQTIKKERTSLEKDPKARNPLLEQPSKAGVACNLKMPKTLPRVCNKAINEITVPKPKDQVTENPANKPKEPKQLNSIQMPANSIRPRNLLPAFDKTKLKTNPANMIVSPIKFDVNTPVKPPVNLANVSVRKSSLARVVKTETMPNPFQNDAEKKKQLQKSISAQVEALASSNSLEIVNASSEKKSTGITIEKIEVLPSIKVDKPNPAILFKNKPNLTIVKRKSTPEDEVRGSPLKNVSESRAENPIKVSNRSTPTKPDLKRVKQETSPSPTKDDPQNPKVLEDSIVFPKKPEIPLKNQIILESIGLPIIVNMSHEDSMLYEDVEKMRQTASKFSQIYRKHDSIWNSRKQKEPLIKSCLSSFTSELNHELGCKLEIFEVKRILNLLSSWLSAQTNLKMCVKVNPTSVCGYYLNLFAFVPKYHRFIFFCETCDEHFTIECDYRKHVVVHRVVYKCPKCFRCFKRKGFYYRHLSNEH